jgi:hypothetical protein
MKGRQPNEQNKKYKRRNNDLQNTTHKTNDQATRTLLKLRMNSSALEGLAVTAPLMIPVVLV